MRTLIDNGHDVSFYILRPVSERDPDFVREMPTVAFLRRPLNWLARLTRRSFYKLAPPSPWGVLREIRQHRPDFIGIHKHRLESWVVVAVARWCGVAVATNVEVPADRVGRSVRDRVLEAVGLLPRVQLGWLRARNGADQILPNKFQHLPPMHHHDCAELIRQRSAQRRAGRPLRILAVAKLGLPRKRLDLAVSAVSALVAEGYAVELVIAGGGDKTAIARLASEACCEHEKPFIEIKANVPYAEMAALYASCDVFLLPSRDEPYSISPLEAMAQGLPAVLSDTNNTADSVEHGVDGWICRTDDLASLIDCLRRFLDDPDLVETMGFAAWNKIRRDHDPQRWHAQFLVIADHAQRLARQRD